MSNKIKLKFIEKNGFNIFIMTWNTESIRLCETMDLEVKTRNRSAGMFGISNPEMWYDGTIPEFFHKLSDEIKNHKYPELIVIGFQEDAYPGCYFHSHMLPEEMPKLGYDIVKRTKLQGIGVTSYKAVINDWDLMARGLRLSIYAKKELIETIRSSEIDLRENLEYDGQLHYLHNNGINQYTRGKGAIASYIIYPGVGIMVFICAHLPFMSHSLIESKYKNDYMIRQDALSQQNICFNNILRTFVKDQKFEPDHIFLFGDLNYRVNYSNAKDLAQKIIDEGNIPLYKNIYTNHDELLAQMKMGTIYGMLEGIDNEGPLFAPTCKMSKERKLTKDSKNEDPEKYYKTGKFYQRSPSWCDRILYCDYTLKSPFNINAISYDRFDTGTTMSKSDHAAVIGVFNLSYTSNNSTIKFPCLL